MSRYDDYTPSMAFNDNVAAPFFRNHVDNQVLEQLSDIGISFAETSINRIDSTIDNLTEMVKRAEVAGEFVVCQDEFHQLPVPRQDIVYCHLNRKPFCATCYSEHRKSCGHCQEAMIRMNVRYFG